MAAVCVSDRYEPWYTTVTEAAEQYLPFYKQPDREDILRYGHSSRDGRATPRRPT